MLDYIRSNAQSLGIKLAFGIIILVFVFWGVGSLQTGGGSGVVATVNKQPIMAQELARALQYAEENIRRNMPDVNSEQIRQMQLGRQVLQQLVVDAVLGQEARRLGMDVTPVELRRAIGQIRVFHNEAGQFDPAVYKRVLEAQRQPPAQFEERMRRGLLEDKFRRDMTEGAYVAPGEARAFYDFAQEARALEYVFFPAEEGKAEAPADDEVKAWYESNRKLFAVPAKRDVQYLVVRPGDLVGTDAISPGEVREYYEKRQGEFATPERVHVRHILLPLPANADKDAAAAVEKTLGEITDALKKGEDFAKLAGTHSKDTLSAAKGGDLGWVERGVTVEPFEKAAFALKPGEVSAPVRSNFGWHLIKCEGREEAGTLPLDKAEADIRAKLAAQKGAERMRDVVDALVEANILGKSLDEAGKPHKLAAQSTGLLSAPELQAKLGLREKDVQGLMQAAAGAPIDNALESTLGGELGKSDGAVVIARVTQAEPEKTRSFDEVKREIVSRLTADRALAAALKQARDIRAAMKDATALPAAQMPRVQKIDKVSRGGDVGALGDEPALSEALFAAPVGQWLPAAYTVSVDGKKGGALVRVTGILPPDDKEWGTLSAAVENRLTNQRQMQMFQSFMEMLLQRADIRITNETLLQDIEKMVH